jgi:hypothetical protein
MIAPLTPCPCFSVRPENLIRDERSQKLSFEAVKRTLKAGKKGQQVDRDRQSTVAVQNASSFRSSGKRRRNGALDKARHLVARGNWPHALPHFDPHADAALRHSMCLRRACNFIINQVYDHTHTSSKRQRAGCACPPTHSLALRACIKSQLRCCSSESPDKLNHGEHHDTDRDPQHSMTRHSCHHRQHTANSLDLQKLLLKTFDQMMHGR